MRVSKDPAVRRREILAAASKLFASKGYEATSVEDIVSQVKVAKGLFYYYFPKKESLLPAIAEDLVEDIQLNFPRQAVQKAGSISELVTTIVDYYLDFVGDKQEVLAIATKRGSVIGNSVRRALEEQAIELTKEILKDYREDIHISYPEYTLRILIRGLGSLYMEGVRDKQVIHSLVLEALGLQNR